MLVRNCRTSVVATQEITQKTDFELLENNQLSFYLTFFKLLADRLALLLILSGKIVFISDSVMDMIIMVRSQINYFEVVVAVLVVIVFVVLVVLVIEFVVLLNHIMESK